MPAKNSKYLDKGKAWVKGEAEPLVKAENVILMGRSIGTGPAIYLSAYSCHT